MGLKHFTGAAALMLSACATGPTAPPSATTLTIPATAARQLSVHVAAPARPKGVVLFSHGGNSWPERYEALFARLNAAGYAVLAPLHVDSRRHPDTARFTLQTALPERVADAQAVARLAAERYPGLPIAAMGHSYGSLVAQMGGGALAYISGARIPAVKAVVAFSTPGRIPGLIQPTAFSTLAVPSLTVTGSEDRVPGLAAGTADHLLAFQGAPAGRHYALVIPGGTHELVGGADPAMFDKAVTAAVAFLDAELLGRSAARRQLATEAGRARLGLQRR